MSSPPILPRDRRIEELSWTEVREAGCYLLVDSGGLARIPCPSSAPALASRDAFAGIEGPTVVKLSDDPGETTAVLRLAAAGRGYPIGF
jgi:hypothetical protein